jgi:hypothetical protein
MIKGKYQKWGDLFGVIMALDYLHDENLTNLLLVSSYWN